MCYRWCAPVRLLSTLGSRPDTWLVLDWGIAVFLRVLSGFALAASALATTGCGSSQGSAVESAASEALTVMADALVRSTNAIVSIRSDGVVSQDLLLQAAEEVFGASGDLDGQMTVAGTGSDAAPSVVVTWSGDGSSCSVTVGADPADLSKASVVSPVTCSS